MTMNLSELKQRSAGELNELALQLGIEGMSRSRKQDIVFAPNTTFKDFGADSLDIVQILVAVEDTYEIELDDEELQNITDTAGFVAYIERKVAEKK